MAEKLHEALGIPEREFKELYRQFSAELVENFMKWRLSDLIEWMTEDITVNRKVKAAVVISLYNIGAKIFNVAGEK